MFPDFAQPTATTPLLLVGDIPSTLVIGAVLLLVGLVFSVKPTLSLAPLGGEAGFSANATGLWGRFVAAIFLLLGGVLSVIGVWNLLYA